MLSEKVADKKNVTKSGIKLVLCSLLLYLVKKWLAHKWAQTRFVGSPACSFSFPAPALRPLFFCFSLTRASYMRPAGKKTKNTEHERVQFLGTTEHERMPYTHATRQKTHTEHERVQF